MSPASASGSKAPGADRTQAAEAPLVSRSPWIVGAAALFVPGAGHALVGQVRKAAVFCGVLLLMFVAGLAFQGRLFPFERSEPLVFLAAIAQWALLLPRLMANGMGLGQGTVTAVTYEYGNTFLIVSGLLNVLVLLDATDRARGVRRS